jgi:hypothetical protein
LFTTEPTALKFVIWFIAPRPLLKYPSHNRFLCPDTRPNWIGFKL